MHQSLLHLLRCPFCGTRLSLVENDALVRAGAGGELIESAVVGCECCAFPIVAGIPILLADESTRRATQPLEAGRPEEALRIALGLSDDPARVNAFNALLTRGPDATYREALAVLSLDAEGTYFLYRFSDPTYLAAESLVEALGRHAPIAGAAALDLCGGSGHLTRTLRRLRPSSRTVLADVFFWKLWLARRFTAPGCEAVCCDADQPLPFEHGAFPLVVLSDAFPYIWNKRLLADEMMRLSGEDGVIVMPHLHSARGENFSAGNALSPSAYHDLFAPRGPRLFSDATLLDDLIERRLVDLSRSLAPSELGDQPSLTLVAGHDDLFRRYDLQDRLDVTGELTVNPLYRLAFREGASVLTLAFPTPEYAAEFAACKRYLPDTVTVEADLTGPILPSTLGARYAELRRRQIVLDAPPRYC